MEMGGNPVRTAFARPGYVPIQTLVPANAVLAPSRLELRSARL
jgi:hypothetical protein